MEKQKLNSKTVEDERIESIYNTYAAKAFYILSFYLVLSIIIKGFTLDVNMFLYWDNAIAMLVGALYMIYRSAYEGVAFDPVSTKVFNAGYIKMFAVTSLFMGLLITFVLSGMDERLAALMPGILEKLAGTVVFGLLFSLIMIAAVWVIDVLPTRMALRKASELAGEPGGELPDDEELIKQSYIKDERIDSTTEKYAAHSLIFPFAYILISTLVKLIFTDLSLIVYFDAFLAAMVAVAYFSYNILKAGVYHEPQLSKKDKLFNLAISVTGFLIIGMFMSFILFPMADSWAALLDNKGMKIAFGLLLAAFFGIGIYLLGKAADWYGKKKENEQMESE